MVARHGPVPRGRGCVLRSAAPSSDTRCGRLIPDPRGQRPRTIRNMGHQTIVKPLVFGTGVLSLATLLAYGGSWSWACELLVNFRTHYALLLGLVLVLALALRT